MTRFWSTFRCETWYSSDSPVTVESFTIVSDDSTTVTSTVLTQGAINAYGIEVQFARSDLEAFSEQTSASEVCDIPEMVYSRCKFPSDLFASAIHNRNERESAPIDINRRIISAPGHDDRVE